MYLLAIQGRRMDGRAGSKWHLATGCVAGHPYGMTQLLLDRFALESDLTMALSRVDGDTPGSPAWDAAMEWVDDLERMLADLSPIDNRPQPPA